MRLTSAHHSRIAAAYERAAADENLPSQLRAGFAEKARWFRMVAEIAAAKQAAVGESTYPDGERGTLLSVGFLADLLNRPGRTPSSDRRPRHVVTNGAEVTTATGSSA
jgi:hypothetical protein